MGLLLDNKNVFHKPEPVPGGGGRVETFPLKILHVQIYHYRAYWRPHSCTFNLFIEFILKGEVCIVQTEPEKFNDALY